MFKNPEDEAYYGQAFGGGIKVVEIEEKESKDPKTGRTVKSYKKVADLGNVPYQNDQGVSAQAAVSGVVNNIGQTVYQGETTGQWYGDKWDAYMDTAQSKLMEYNQKTGGWDIYVPEEIANSKAYKETFENDSTLGKLSSIMQQYGEDYKFADPQNPDSTITAKDYVERYAKGLADLMQKGYNLHQYQEQLASSKDVNADMVRSLDFDQMAMIADTDVASDNYGGYLYLPKSWVEGNGSSALAKSVRESGKWNSETGFISQDDFKELYNLDNGVERDDILTAMGQAKAKLRMGWVQEKEGDAPDQEYLDDYARSLSFLNYLQDNDPDGSWWRKAGLDAGAVAEGVAEGFTKATFAFDSFMDNFGVIGQLLGGAIEVKAGPVGWGMLAGGRGSELVQQKSADQIVKELSSAQDWYVEGLHAVNDTAVGFNVIGELAGQIAADIVISKGVSNLASTVASGVGAAGETALNRLSVRGATLSPYEQSLAAAAEGTKTGSGIVSGITSMSEAVGQTVPKIYNLTTKEVKAVTKAMDFMLKAVSPAQASQLLNKVVAVKNTLDSPAMKTASKVFTTTADFLTDTVLDAVISDPENVRKVITGEYTEGETRDYVMQQIAMNASGMVVFGLGAKVLKGAGKLFNKTKVGRIANTKVSQIINGISSKAGNKLDDIQTWWNKGEDEFDKLAREAAEARAAGKTRKASALDDKAYVLQQRRAVRTTQAQFAGMKISEDGLEAVEAAQNTIRAMNNAIDSYQRSIAFKLAEYVNPDVHPTIAGYHVDIADARTAIIRAERAAGSGATIPTSKGGETFTVLSQESSNYIGETITIERANNVIERASRPGATTLEIEQAAKAKAALPEHQKALDDLKQTFSPELVGALDNAIPLYKGFYAEFDGYLYEWGENGVGLMNASQRASFEANPDNYIRLQYADEASEWRMERIDGKITNKSVSNIEHVDFGKRGDFVDPEITRYEYMIEKAQVERSATFAGTYFDMPGAAKKTVVSGEETERLYTFKQGEKNAKAAAKEYSMKFGENADIRVHMAGGEPKVTAKPAAPTGAQLRVARDNIIASLTGSDFENILTSQGVAEGSFFKQLDNELAGLDINFPEAQRRYEYWRSQFDDKTNDWIDQTIIQYADPGEPVPYDSLDKYGRISWRADDVAYGRKAFDDFVKDERELFWKSFKSSNGGTETFYTRDELGNINGRHTVSNNGELYRKLYAEGGRKPTKAQFNEAFDDVLEKGSESEYYEAFREFSPEDIGRPTYNEGNMDIDDVLLLKGLEPVAEPVVKPSTDLVAFKQAQQNLGADFEDQLNRTYLMHNEEFRNSELMNGLVENQLAGQRAAQKYILTDSVADDIKNIKGIDHAATAEGFVRDFGDNIDNTVNNMLTETDFEKAIKAMSDAEPGTFIDDIREYVVLSEMRRADNRKLAKANIDKQIDAELKGKDVSLDDAAKLKKTAHSTYDDVLDDKYNSVRNRLSESGSHLVDQNEWYDEVKKLDDKIMGAEKAAKSSDTNTIMMMDEKGRVNYVEVDPAIASLYKYRPGLSSEDMSVLSKFSFELSKIFRFGTTTANLKSMVNQGFRDTGNATIVGGAWSTIKNSSKYFADTFGDEVADALGDFESREIRLIAQRDGIDIAEAAAKREAAIGAALSPASTEASLYAETAKGIRNAKQGIATTNKIFDQAQNKTRNIIDKIDGFANGKREEYLRKRVYTNALNEAMDRGFSIKQARQYAQFAMNNATTNFSRSLYHLNNFASSVPYLKAGINGTKSFWRMWSLDPLAITSRIMGGVVLPVWYLVGQSLGDPENRKVYENLPEYQKTDRIPFVVGGEFFSIPIPQELSALVDPARHFVEYLHGAQPNAFQELMLNDVLGFSPLNMQGFALLDQNTMLNNPTMLDRLDQGFSQLFSQMAPIPVKSVYMAVTGKDPYTGRVLRDRSKTYYDDESGEWVTQTNTQSELTNLIDEHWPGANSGIINKVLSGVFGQTGMDVLDSIVAAATGTSKMAGADTFLTKQGQVAGRALTSEVYDKIDSDWSDAVKTMQDRKDALMNDPAVQKINEQLARETDESKRKALLAQRANYTDPYTEQVAQMVTNLKEKYNGSFDRYRFSSVIQLLNFGTDANWYQGNAYAQKEGQTEFMTGWKTAVNTAYNAGIPNTDDYSIFGYVKQDYNTGEPKMVWSTPLGILDARNSVWTQSSVNLSNVKSALESKSFTGDGTLSQKMQTEYWDKYNKLKSNDYDGKDKLSKEWNNKVWSAIAPTLTGMTTDDVVNNSDIINYLEKYIRVPSAYQKVKGRYVSSGYDAATGTTVMDKNTAFIKNYVRTMMKAMKGEQ